MLERRRARQLAPARRGGIDLIGRRVPFAEHERDPRERLEPPLALTAAPAEAVADER